MKNLSIKDKEEMYKNIDSLSVDNLYLLAENDPIINENEAKDNFSGLLGLSSDMQSYTNSLELQKPITLEGEGIPDIISDQAKARENAKIWRVEISPEINKNYTEFKSFLNFLDTVDEKIIEDIVNSALISQSGKEEFSTLIEVFSNDAGKYNKNASTLSGHLKEFNTILNTDYLNFLKAYEIIDKIFNDTDGKRAILRRRIQELLAEIQNYNVGIGIASAAIVLCVLVSILSAVLSVVSAGTTQIIVGGAVAVGTAMVGSLPELVKKRDEAQAEYNEKNAQLAYLNKQCGLANGLLNNINSMLNYNGKITPQIDNTARIWGTIGNNYQSIKESTDSGLTSNSALVLKLRLKAAYKTAKSLIPIAEQCELNQLLPVEASKQVVELYRLPDYWAGKPIDSELFYNYVDLLRA